MKTVLLNDKQRKKIVNLVRPKENDYYSYQNLNLLTAVFDEDTKIYLTLAYYLSSSIKRTDEHYDDYTYVMLTPMGNYVVCCKEEAGNYKGIFSPLPVLISNKKILELIEYYRHSFSERFSMEKEAKKEMDLEGKGFTEWYLEKHYFEKKENAKCVNTTVVTDTTINKSHRIKIFSRICYGLSVISLVVGASFHGYRIHPEYVEHYNIGVTMGITMIMAFMIFLVAGILLTLMGKRKSF